MHQLKEIEQFFHQLAPQVISLVADQFDAIHQLTAKDGDRDPANFATETDIAVEELLVAELQKQFPNDAVLAEEQNSETATDATDQLWIIDPICGTSNFAAGIQFFCTNIAVARNGKLIAACVIDHCRREYIWSIGGGEIFIGAERVSTDKRITGIHVDVDLSAVYRGSDQQKQQHLGLVRQLLLESRYVPITHMSSLGFAYTALGRSDAYIVHPTHVWDVAAANFLLLQAGGTVTELSGAPWTLNSTEVLAARTADLHSELREMLKSNANNEERV